MEKINRNLLSASKTNSDCKGKQDAGNKYPRLPRHKEGSSPHTESRWKPNPQKNREVFDKRPRTRTGPFSERFRSQVVEGIDYEDLPKQGNKKVNLNHLLNFTLPPVDGREFGGRRGTSIYNRNKLPKYNKELFLQANCQFIVRDDGNYAVYYENADALVEWSLIQEVRLRSHEVPSCPICLFPPVAAKITRCGHIYCWPCILHYLALTDKVWQNCPICFEAVHKVDLKSVLPTTQKPILVSDEITMCLMKRERGSMFPGPSTFQKSPFSACKVDNDEALTRFQKLLMASKKYVWNIIKRERNELCELLSREKDAPEACFIESALKLLYEREYHLLETCAKPVGNSFNQERTENNNMVLDTNPVKHLDNNLEKLDICAPYNTQSEDTVENIAKIEAEAKLYPAENIENSQPLPIMPEGGNAESNASCLNKREKDYFFYQAEDGQHTYLHNINVRMLVKEFGSLENSPKFIKAKVVELEKTSMTEVLRKRLRYLQHIPLTCELQVAELNLHYLLSKSTIDEFMGEVVKRQNQRCRKAREERKREKYIEQEENRKLGKYPGATYNLNSIAQFPLYDPIKDLPPLSEQPIDTKLLQNEEYDKQYPRPSSSSPCIENSPEPSTSPATSFAQMLREGKSSFVERHPAVDHKNTEGRPHTIVDSDNEDWASAPEYRMSFSDAFQAAFDTANKKKDDVPADGKQGTSKKKKTKNKLLFTTSMCRNK